MNIAISKAYNQASDGEKGKIEIRPATPFISRSMVELERTDKNVDDFISVTYRCRPSAGYYKKKSHNPSQVFSSGALVNYFC